MNTELIILVSLISVGCFFIGKTVCYYENKKKVKYLVKKGMIDELTNFIKKELCELTKKEETEKEIALSKKEQNDFKKIEKKNKEMIGLKNEIAKDKKAFFDKLAKKYKYSNNGMRVSGDVKKLIVFKYNKDND